MARSGSSRQRVPDHSRASMISRKHSFSQLSQTDLEEEEEDRRSEYVEQELVDKVRSKVDCCLVNWLIHIACSNSKFLW